MHKNGNLTENLQQGLLYSTVERNLKVCMASVVQFYGEWISLLIGL